VRIPQYARGERRFGLWPTVMRSEVGVGHSLEQLICLLPSPNWRASAPDSELTPQALAEMSEERFAEVFAELQARGDKAKLRQLFGA
jgi:hypothetical protein